MNDLGESILKCLRQIALEREHRSADPALGSRVVAVKQFQHARFSRTYADLLADLRYGPAARFFLEDLYGPTDFAERDAQFARVVPTLVRMFPADVVATVAQLATLHALSERLDSAMAVALDGMALEGRSYAQVWRRVGEPLAREQQIALTLSVGEALDRHTHKPLLRHSLRLMRRPAKAAGLSALHLFLEAGFDSFRAMAGAGDFLATIARRERALAASLFGGADLPGDGPG